MEPLLPILERDHRHADLRWALLALVPLRQQPAESVRRFVGPMLRATWMTVGLVLVAACGEDEEVEGVIDRETFIATYVDLRRAALQQPTRQLPDTARDRILAAHGVTSDQLMQ